MSIYSKLEYIPYFYIIQHKYNGKYYAGSKYAEDANPNIFMIENGYHTSSEIIKCIIKEQGLGSFSICKIRTFKEGIEAHNYETKFLQRINAAAHPLFYNGHNNNGYYCPEYRKQKMLEKFGVDNYAKTKEFPIKFKETSQKKFGVDHHLQNPEILQKQIDTCRSRYNVDNVFQSEPIKELIYQTKLEKYGVGNFVNPKKAKETCLGKYGENHFSKTDQGRETHSQLQKERNARGVVTDIKKLMSEAELYEIDLSKDFNLTKFWWQRKEDDLLYILDRLVIEIELAKSENRLRKTKKEKMQELNAYLYNRPIVNELREKAKKQKIKLGPAWWRKNEKELLNILRSI